MVSCEMICGGTTQLNWVRVHDSGLLGNSNSNIALTGSSSSEASIKATLTGSTDSTHTKVSSEITTHNILHLRVAAEFNYYKPSSESSKVLQSLILHKLFMSRCSGKIKQHLTKR